jgi:hypothetical protein
LRQIVSQQSSVKRQEVSDTAAIPVKRYYP